MDSLDRDARLRRDILHDVDADLSWKLGSFMVIVAVVTLLSRYC